MSNDTPEDTRRLQGKFDAAIAMVVDTFLETGLHPLYMRDALKRQLDWVDESVRSSS